MQKDYTCLKQWSNGIVLKYSYFEGQHNNILEIDIELQGECYNVSEVTSRVQNCLLSPDITLDRVFLHVNVTGCRSMTRIDGSMIIHGYNCNVVLRNIEMVGNPDTTNKEKDNVYIVSLCKPTVVNACSETQSSKTVDNLQITDRATIQVLSGAVLRLYSCLIVSRRDYESACAALAEDCGSELVAYDTSFVSDSGTAICLNANTAACIDTCSAMVPKSFGFKFVIKPDILALARITNLSKKVY